jgi:hypothetical protein
MIPAFTSSRLERRAREARDGRAEPTLAVERIDEALPVWTELLPTELYASALRHALGGRERRAGLALGLLLFEAAALYALSSAVHERLLGAAGGSGGRRKARGEFPSFTAAGLPPRVAAVALAQARTALRSVRGRLLVLLPGPVMALVGVFVARAPDEVPGGTPFALQGPTLFAGGLLFSLYALLALVANQLASDRAGLTLQLLAPISDAELARGKAIGCGVVFATQGLVCLACTLAVDPRGPASAWLAVALAGAASYLWTVPAGALFSILLPVPADLGKTGTGGNPHGLAMLAGSLLLLALAAPPAAALAVVGTRMQRPGLALLLIAGWAALAAAASVPLLGAVSRLLGPRRENLALVARER